METSWLTASTSGVSAHLLFFALAIGALVVFVTVYVAITPHREFTLIRQGNSAAAISLGGAILGYTIPLAKAVSQSESIGDMLIWAGVAMVAQILAYLVARLVLKELSANVGEGKLAPATFLATIALAFGLLNAAAMTN